MPFHFVAHMAMEHENTMSYETEDERLGFCDHTPKRKNVDFGRTYRHYRIEGKVYKTKAKFLEAIKDFNQKKEEPRRLLFLFSLAFGRGYSIPPPPFRLLFRSNIIIYKRGQEGACSQHVPSFRIKEL